MRPGESDGHTARAQLDSMLEGARPVPDNALGQPAHYRPPRSLVLRSPGIPDVRITLDPTRDYRIGRNSDENDLVLRNDETVSRRHGRLACDPNGVWLYADQRSANGTGVAGRAALTNPIALAQAPRLEPYAYRPMSAGDVLVFAKGRSSIELSEEVVRPEPADQVRWASAGGRALEKEIRKFARSSQTVFILGPSGAGKTFVAEQIHARSSRHAAPYVPINCAQLGSDVNRIHSELLGHTKGAFTGAIQHREGVLTAAHGGTVFLDEVESLTPEAQGFLLSVVEPARALRPMGASESSPPLKVDVRFISASKVALARSGLRRDLAERLSELNLILPTLEDRREDIPLLVELLLAEQRPGERPPRIDPEAVDFLAARDYPGQVRELGAALRMAANEARFRAEDDGLGSAKAVITRGDLEVYFDQRDRAHGRGHRASQTAMYRVADVDVLAVSPPIPRKRPVDLQRVDVEQALRAAGGNQTHAAGSLGISLNTLKAKMKAFGLRKDAFGQTSPPSRVRSKN